MSLRFLFDYLSGDFTPVLPPTTSSSTVFVETQNIDSGDFALVLVPGGSITPPSPSYFIPAFAGFILIPQ